MIPMTSRLIYVCALLAIHHLCTSAHGFPFKLRLMRASVHSGSCERLHMAMANSIRRSQIHSRLPPHYAIMKSPIGGKSTTLAGDPVAVSRVWTIPVAPCVTVGVSCAVGTVGLVSAIPGWMVVVGADSEVTGAVAVDGSSGTDGAAVWASREEVASLLTEDSRMGWESLIGAFWRAWLGITGGSVSLAYRMTRPFAYYRGRHLLRR